MMMMNVRMTDSMSMHGEHVACAWLSGAVASSRILVLELSTRIQWYTNPVGFLFATDPSEYRMKSVLRRR